MKPYLAVDIETTGLDLNRSQVLQLAAIYVDGQQTKEFNILVDNGPLVGEAYALKLNGWILGELVAKTSNFTRQSKAAAIESFQAFLADVAPSGRLTIAGKNVAGFDVPILRAQGFDVSRFSHRVIDVGSLYYPDFGYVPSLDEVNKKLGREAVVHDALADCQDVVTAIGYKVGGRVYG